MKKPKEIVKEFVLKYIKEKPTRISLKLDWDKKSSIISLYEENLNQSIRRDRVIDFTSFAQGILEAYRETYGEFQIVPVSFREEIYENEKVSLDLYPTGSLGIFDIYIKYKV